MSDSLKQQLYALLADADAGLAELGFTIYGSENDTATDGPPPVEGAPLPWAYLRLADEFVLGPFDQRAIVQVRLGDGERDGYYRINAGLARLAVLFAPNRQVTYQDATTTEVWWQPEPAGASGETEDPDRPGTVLRWGEWSFRKAVGAALAAAVS
jgi:hypothetical protein